MEPSYHVANHFGRVAEQERHRTQDHTVPTYPQRSIPTQVTYKAAYQRTYKGAHQRPYDIAHQRDEPSSQRCYHTVIFFFLHKRSALDDAHSYPATKSG